jgi:hypothetical protein
LQFNCEHVAIITAGNSHNKPASLANPTMPPLLLLLLLQAVHNLQQLQAVHNLQQLLATAHLSGPHPPPAAAASEGSTHFHAIAAAQQLSTWQAACLVSSPPIAV